jgi:hypothetical protein
MSHEELRRQNPDDLKQVQETLAALAPRPPQVDRDRLMFLAGAAAASGGRQPPEVTDVARRASLGNHFWPAATAALGATSLAIALVVRMGASPQIVYVERPSPEDEAMGPNAVVRINPTPDSPSAAIADEPRSSPRIAESLASNRPAMPRVPADNYLRSREVALRMGLDALGAPRSGGGSTSAVTYLDWLASQGGDSSSPPAAPDSALPQM